MQLDERCQPIELILCDVDGVLTDGGIIVNNQGIETKRFHVRDGMGIKLWQKAGYRFGVITCAARTSSRPASRSSASRSSVRGPTISWRPPRKSCKGWDWRRARYAISATTCPTSPWSARVGLGVAVADACTELCSRAHLVTRSAGERARCGRWWKRSLKRNAAGTTSSSPTTCSDIVARNVFRERTSVRFKRWSLPSMIRLVRIAVSFALVVGAYAAYSSLVVPAIEPPVETAAQRRPAARIHRVRRFLAGEGAGAVVSAGFLAGEEPHDPRQQPEQAAVPEIHQPAQRRSGAASVHDRVRSGRAGRRSGRADSPLRGDRRPRRRDSAFRQAAAIGPRPTWAI